jgi:hypothetical protein
MRGFGISSITAYFKIAYRRVSARRWWRNWIGKIVIFETMFKALIDTKLFL